MKKKLVYIFALVAVISTISLVLINNKISLRNINASVVDRRENNDIIIDKAREMINDNINNYSDGNHTITIKDLIDNKYIDKELINKETNEKYDENIRIIFNIKDRKITDIVIKNQLFKDKLCENLCYFTDNKYISFNSKLYKILKIDSDGYTYAMDENILINKNKINDKLDSIYNKLDNNYVYKVDSVSYIDITKSKIISRNDDIFVKDVDKYNIYDINNKIVSNTNEAYLIPVIVFNNKITYEMGDGSKFNPYIIDK